MTTTTAPPRRVEDWEPVGIADRYLPPEATVHPDRSRGWIRRMAPILRAHAALFAGALITALLAMVTRVAVPRIVGEAVDQSLTAQVRPLSFFVWILGGLTVVQIVTGFFSRRSIYRMAFRVEYDLRHAVFARLTELSLPFYDRSETGQLVSRANTDIRAIQMFLTFGPLIVLSVSSMLIALAFMLTVSVPMTIVALAPLPVVAMLGLRSRNLMFPLQWLVMARQADVATTVEENVSGVRVIRGFAAEQREIDKLVRNAARLRWSQVQEADVNARYSPVLENLPRLGLVAVLIVGGALAADGTIGVGALIAFSTYVVMLQTPFRFLGFIVTMSQRAAASASRIFEILDESIEVAEAPGAPDLEVTRGEVEFRDVRFGYAGSADVLDGFDLRLRPGETVALVGATGSGKSTVSRLLPRFYDVRGGSILIDGQDVREVTLPSLRAQVGVLTDEPFLFSATVRENLTFGRPDASEEEIREAARAAQALAFIEGLEHGFDHHVGERGYTLSGGQRQRLALARSLLANPPVLVLDDATSAVDVEVEQRIHAALARLMQGRTTLLIAHRISTMALADRVVLLRDGRVVADGPHHHLLATEPAYRELLDQLGGEVG